MTPSKRKRDYDELALYDVVIGDDGELDLVEFEDDEKPKCKTDEPSISRLSFDQAVDQAIPDAYFVVIGASAVLLVWSVCGNQALGTLQMCWNIFKLFLR